MDILKKGGTAPSVSSQPVGTLEDWLTYFFNETKPFTIEQCFQAVSEGNLEPFQIRNRACVEAEGSIYLLFRQVTDEQRLVGAETKPTATKIDEAAEKGVIIIKCPVCGALNDVLVTSMDNTCFQCLGQLPEPSKATPVREVLRLFDFKSLAQPKPPKG